MKHTSLRFWSPLIVQSFEEIPGCWSRFLSILYSSMASAWCLGRITFHFFSLSRCAR